MKVIGMFVLTILPSTCDTHPSNGRMEERGKKKREERDEQTKDRVPLSSFNSYSFPCSLLASLVVFALVFFLVCFLLSFYSAG